MDEEEIQTQVTKFPRLGNGTGTGRADSSKIAHKLADQNYPDDELGTQLKRVGVGTGNRLTDNGTTNRLRGWHHSRIIRVSRTTGGKDRHSKVLTSKGLRDRRVRLSVATAIQFYDIQDRLGYDQPSKAVEWLIRAASDSIAELPSLNGTFAESPKQLSDEKRGSEGAEPGGGGEGGGGGGGFDSAEVGIDIDADSGNYHLQPNQHVSLSKSACSSTSETSKGSGLSLSRSEIRVNREKARERARERTAKEKDKEPTHQQTSLNPSIAQNPSFTELLTSGIGGGAVGGNNNNNSSSSNNNNNATSSTSPSGSNHHRGEGGLFQKMAAPARWGSLDYFGTGFSGNSLSRAPPHHSSGFPGIHMGVATNSSPLQVPPFSISGDGANHQELQAFSFVPDHHLIPTAAATTTSSQAGVSGGEYDLNFTISSSGLGGYNRGTLQSNSSSSPSLLPQHIQRFSSIDGSSVPFFIGTATPVVENHHHNHHVSQFPPGLQLCYGDGTRHSDQKGKTKN